MQEFLLLPEHKFGRRARALALSFRAIEPDDPILLQSNRAG